MLKPRQDWSPVTGLFKFSTSIPDVLIWGSPRERTFIHFKIRTLLALYDDKVLVTCKVISSFTSLCYQITALIVLLTVLKQQNLTPYYMTENYFKFFADFQLVPRSNLCARVRYFFSNITDEQK